VNHTVKQRDHVINSVTSHATMELEVLSSALRLHTTQLIIDTKRYLLVQRLDINNIACNEYFQTTMQRF